MKPSRVTLKIREWCINDCTTPNIRSRSGVFRWNLVVFVNQKLGGGWWIGRQLRSNCCCSVAGKVVPVVNGVTAWTWISTTNHLDSIDCYPVPEVAARSRRAALVVIPTPMVNPHELPMTSLRTSWVMIMLDEVTSLNSGSDNECTHNHYTNREQLFGKHISSHDWLNISLPAFNGSAAVGAPESATPIIAVSASSPARQSRTARWAIWKVSSDASSGTQQSVNVKNSSIMHYFGRRSWYRRQRLFFLVVFDGNRQIICMVSHVQQCVQVGASTVEQIFASTGREAPDYCPRFHRRQPFAVHHLPSMV